MVRCSYASIVAVLVSSGNKIAAGFRAAATQLCMLIPFPFVQPHRMRNDDVYALCSPQPTACGQLMVAMMSFDLMYSTYKKRASCELQR
jgi:hypothetical protein